MAAQLFLDDRKDGFDVRSCAVGQNAIRHRGDFPGNLGRVGGHAAIDFALVILDEGAVAAHLGLFPIGDLLRLLDERPPTVEVVITGRHAPKALLRKADLVTEMKDVRHYYARGVKARLGIEE